MTYVRRVHRTEVKMRTVLTRQRRGLVRAAMAVWLHRTKPKVHMHRLFMRCACGREEGMLREALYGWHLHTASGARLEHLVGKMVRRSLQVWKDGSVRKAMVRWKEWHASKGGVMRVMQQWVNRIHNGLLLDAFDMWHGIVMERSNAVKMASRLI